MGRHTPEKIDHNTATFAVGYDKCAKCCKDMVVEPSRQYFERTTFPYHFANDFNAQAKRGGFVVQSVAKVDDSYICVECEKAGLADFLCALCNERHPTSEIESSFGDPPEHLCKPCYSTVPAKQWDDEEGKLRESHKYDYE